MAATKKTFIFWCIKIIHLQNNYILWNMLFSHEKKQFGTLYLCGSFGWNGIGLNCQLFRQIIICTEDCVIGLFQICSQMAIPYTQLNLRRSSDALRILGPYKMQ
jgi:hypothetical protein